MLNPELTVNSEFIEKNINKITLLDVREPEEYMSEHLNGCILIPLADLEFRAEAELNKEDDIVVYCAHGIRSMHGVMILKQLGFKKCRSLTGGIVTMNQNSELISK